MKSPQTTTVAILAIVAGISKALYSLFGGDGLPGGEDIALVLSGIGFLFARDNNRTDKEAGAVVAAEKRETKRTSPGSPKTNTTAGHGPRQ